MSSKYLACLSPTGFHKLHYLEWGDPDCPRTLICVHGLTRNAHDFDFLAQSLANEYRVICPDMPGRGQSDWLDAGDGYTFSIYLNDLVALIARLDVTSVSWLGTSMGGLLGIYLAGLHDSPIDRILLNDIGPALPDVAIQRIREYVGKDPRFKSLEELEKYLRTIHAAFGNLTDRQWRHLAEHSFKAFPSGEYGLHYDPAIAGSFTGASLNTLELWDFWDRIACPVAVFRGENSDVLLEETASQMQIRGPKAKLFTLENIGHAPSLMSADQVDMVRDWFCGE